MVKKGIIIFYLTGLIVSLISGFIWGFTDSHTPPIPFVVECLVLIIGLMMLGISFVKYQKMNDLIKVQLFGFILNAFLLIIIVIL